MSSPTEAMTDPDCVAEQYADESRLATRQSVWRPGADGRDPVESALAAVRAGLPAGRAMPDVLEVGCGPGAFAERLLDECPGIALLAVDTSPRMVELAAARGVTARLMDLAHLLAPAAAYDVVVALWMLYHLPDLDAGLAEAVRVLRPGGRLVAATNGEHLTAVRREGGGEPLLTTFSSENGEAALRRHFESVTREDLTTRAVFADRDAALAYLASSGEDVEWSLPHDGWPREYAGHVTIFVASTRARSAEASVLRRV